jgi:hypothetical protein
VGAGGIAADATSRIEYVLAAAEVQPLQQLEPAGSRY